MRFRVEADQRPWFQLLGVFSGSSQLHHQSLLTPILHQGELLPSSSSEFLISWKCNARISTVKRADGSSDCGDFTQGLSFYTTEDVLRQKFLEFGEVVDVKIIMDRVSQRSKGFGFIWYASEMDAEKAKTEMNGKVMNGRIINVDAVKKPKWAKSQLRGDLPGGKASSLFDRETGLGQDSENFR